MTDVTNAFFGLYQKQLTNPSLILFILYIAKNVGHHSNAPYANPAKTNEDVDETIDPSITYYRMYSPLEFQRQDNTPQRYFIDYEICYDMYWDL